MSLTVTQRPNQSGVWVAAKNPVIYKMTRKDYAWTLLVTSAGNTSIRIATDVTSHFVAGYTIWLEADDGAYSATGSVVSSSFGTYTTVVTDVPYVADNAAGYINTITQRLNYYVGISVYKDSDDSLIGTVNYYPTKKGLITIDISQTLQTAIEPSVATITNGAILLDTNPFEAFYIKYTEYWTGSAESATDDSGNVSYGVLAANQIGQNGYLTATSFLTKQDLFKIMMGEYYSISFFDSVGYTSLFLKKSWYSSGAIFAANYIKTQDSPVKSIFTYFNALDKTFSTTPNWYEALYFYLNIDNGGTIAWTLPGTISGGVTVTTGNTSKTGCALCYIPTGNSVSIKWILSISGTGTFFCNLCWFDSAGSLISSSTITTSFGNNQTGIVTITPASDVYYIGFKIINSGAGTITVITGGGPGLQLIIPNTFNRVDFIAASIPAALPFVETDLNNSVSATIVPYCNPITLFWRNSLGGESSWSFVYNQEQIQRLQEPFKNKQLTLYDQNLTLGQFNALNELFSLSQVYQTPLIELTTSIDKTEARIGQQVYIIDSSGNKTGVIVIPGENRTTTRRNKHNFQVTIELPEIFG